MRIRTQADFQDRIDNDFGWRRVDIIRFRSLVISSRGTLNESTYIRAAIPLLYAHWEGFVKEASVNYINFVSQLRLPYKELSKPFVLLHVKEKLLASSLNSMDKAERIYNFFLTEFASNSNLKSIPEPIDTQSNLKSYVLKEIIALVGLNYAPFEPYGNFIDAVLINNRNKIAHGEFNSIDYSKYDEIHTTTLKLMTLFKDEIQNAATLKAYKI